MGEDTLVIKQMTVTDFYQHRSSVINAILTGTQGVIFTRYNSPVAMLMPVPEAIKNRIYPGGAPGEVVPTTPEDDTEYEDSKVVPIAGSAL